MTDTTSALIRSADWARDGAAVKALCWAYRDLLESRMTGFPGLLDRYYAPPDYTALMEDLPRIHARPQGDILIAERGGTILGCAMYYPLATPGLCEIKRIFVTPEARGAGIATGLVTEAETRAAADGYTRMVLDTMIDLTEAIALYRKLGFTPAEPFYDLAPEAAPAIRFFGKDLAPLGKTPPAP